MRAFIQSKGGIPRGTSSYAAWMGFNHMGVETVLYKANDELTKCEREDVVVGGLGVAWFRLQALGINPRKIDYPEELTGFLGRKVWRSTINHVSNERDSWPLFVKPVDEKRFVGRVVRGIKDLIGAGCSGDDAPVICSEVVEFSGEHRCFVRYGKIPDVRHYRGDWAVCRSHTRSSSPGPVAGLHLSACFSNRKGLVTLFAASPEAAARVLECLHR